MNIGVARRIAAQVAVEAVADNPEAYDTEAIEAVRQNGRYHGVSPLYMDLLPKEVK